MADQKQCGAFEQLECFAIAAGFPQETREFACDEGGLAPLPCLDERVERLLVVRFGVSRLLRGGVGGGEGVRHGGAVVRVVAKELAGFGGEGKCLAGVAAVCGELALFSAEHAEVGRRRPEREESVGPVEVDGCVVVPRVGDQRARAGDVRACGLQDFVLGLQQPGCAPEMRERGFRVGVPSLLRFFPVDGAAAERARQLVGELGRLFERGACAFERSERGLGRGEADGEVRSERTVLGDALADFVQAGLEERERAFPCSTVKYISPSAMYRSGRTSTPSWPERVAASSSATASRGWLR